MSTTQPGGHRPPAARQIARVVAVCVAVAVGAGGLVAAAPARGDQAAPAGATGPVMSRGLPGGCLDDYGDQASGGTPVEVWGCNGGPGQLWTLRFDGTIQVNGLCLTAAGGPNAPGANLADPAVKPALLAGCIAGAASQQWRVRSTGELVNSDGGGCLDGGTSFGLAGGLGLVADACTGAAAQQWDIYPYGTSPESQLEDLAGNGDLSLSIDDGGLDPGLVQQVISTYLPQSVGLPPGSSADDISQAGFSQVRSDLAKAGDDTTGLVPPPSLPGESISVNGPAITVTIPRADLSQLHATGLIEWGVQIAAYLAGTATGVIVSGTCLAALTIAAATLCSIIGSIANEAVYLGVYYALEPSAFHPPTWQTLAIAVLASGFIQGTYTYAIWPAVKKSMPGLFQRAGNAVASALQAYPWGAAVGTGVRVMLTTWTILAEMALAIVGIMKAIGPAPTELNGPGQIVSAIPASPSGKCLDNQGNSSSAGTVVDLWDCGTPGTTNWIVWSNGEVTSNGLCLTAPGTDNNTRLVLAICGEPGQLWAYNGTSHELVEQGSGRCLDDPGGTTIGGAQQQIYDCWGGVNQQWILPPANP